LACTKAKYEEDIMSKVLVVVLAIVCCSFVSSVFAQSVADEDEIIRSALQTQKKAIVAANMGFTEAESQAFWPVYEEYQKGLGKINERTATFLRGYARDYNTMTDDKASELLKDYLFAAKERLALDKKFMKKFAKVLPVKKVTRFYQVEYKLEAIVKYEFAKAIPLVK
jgi:hypothetical protein